MVKETSHAFFHLVLNKGCVIVMSAPEKIEVSRYSAFLETVIEQLTVMIGDLLVICPVN